MSTLVVTPDNHIRPRSARYRRVKNERWTGSTSWPTTLRTHCMGGLQHDPDAAPHFEPIEHQPCGTNDTCRNRNCAGCDASRTHDGSFRHAASRVVLQTAAEWQPRAPR